MNKILPLMLCYAFSSKYEDKISRTAVFSGLSSLVLLSESKSTTLKKVYFFILTLNLSILTWNFLKKGPSKCEPSLAARADAQHYKELWQRYKKNLDERLGEKLCQEALRENIENVKFLLGFIHPDTPNSLGKTAVECIIEDISKKGYQTRQSKECLQILISHGADSRKLIENIH